MAASDTTLIIKNPSRNNHHFSVGFRLDGTIAELQQLLYETYDGKPAPADQTLIYGGKVLKDTSVRLRDIVSKHDAPEGPHSIHLVVKHKPATVTASPARSVDSSAAGSVSRTTSSTWNQISSSAARPVPPPTRTITPTGPTSNSGAGPSGSQSQAQAQPSSEAPCTNDANGAAAAHADADDASASSIPIWATWGNYPAAPAGSYGPMLGGYPYSFPQAYGGMHPGAPAGPPSPGETGATNGDPAATTAAASSAGAQNPASVPLQYTYFNPVVGCAYQAAYSAALAALSVSVQAQGAQQGASDQQLQQQHPPSDAQAPAAPGAAAASGSSSEEAGGETAAQGQAAAGDGLGPPAAGGQQQYTCVPMFVPAYGHPAFAYGYGGYGYGYPFPPPGAAGGVRRPGGLPSLWLQGGGQVPQSLEAYLAALPAMEGEEDLVNLTAVLEALDGALDGVRRPGGRGEAGQQERQGAAGAAGAREGQQGGLRRRARYIAVPVGGNEAVRNRLAQALAAAAPRRARVFTIRISARMLLQLLVFAVVLYQHFTWRRFIALLVGGAVLFITSTWAPFRRLMRGIHAMPGQHQRPGAGGAAGGAAGGQPQEVQRRGILTEILVFIVGFITSLLPAWNFNPDDAAAFAAAQEMIAAAERAAQQQQQQGPVPDGGMGAEAGQDAAEAQGNPAPQGGPLAEDGEDDDEGRQAAAAGAAL